MELGAFSISLVNSLRHFRDRDSSFARCGYFLGWPLAIGAPANLSGGIRLAKNRETELQIGTQLAVPGHRVMVAS